MIVSAPVLLLLVGLSFSLSHAFSLLANRLTPRQILVRLLLDALVLALVILLFRQSWQRSYLRLAEEVEAAGVGAARGQGS